MKDTLTDANFPRTADQRVYHLGLRPGEVANRILTVGSPSRAHAIAAHLDVIPELFTLSSERGFLTITGRYRGTPVSIVSIGMGSPNMDFFVREVRECLSGDMIVVRLGSCGALVDVPVGSVVVPQSSVAVIRDVDFDFVNGDSEALPYRISKPAFADAELHTQVLKSLESARPAASHSIILPGTVNASADSFYSSQGRQTSFPDRNANLIEHLQQSTEGVATLEMETFHLLHLAACWGNTTPSSKPTQPPPLTTSPVHPTISQTTSSEISAPPAQGLTAADSRIRAAAAQLVFASRTSQDFITPSQVTELEAWTGRGVLDALYAFMIDVDKLHGEMGSVWETK